MIPKYKSTCGPSKISFIKTGNRLQFANPDLILSSSFLKLSVHFEGQIQVHINQDSIQCLKIYIKSKDKTFIKVRGLPQSDAPDQKNYKSVYKGNPKKSNLQSFSQRMKERKCFPQTGVSDRKASQTNIIHSAEYYAGKGVI